MTTYTLQLVPSGYKVVPVDLPIFSEKTGLDDSEVRFIERLEFVWKEACYHSPPLNTPPVLRWEGNHLMLGTRSIAVACGGHWGAFDMDGVEQSVEQARRSAERALGFPDGLIIEEV